MANLLTILKVLISVLALSRMADTEIVLSTNGRRAQTILLAGNTEQRSYYSFVSLLTQLRNNATTVCRAKRGSHKWHI